MPTLISLISDHLLPNLLFIKDMEGQVDDYVFITTDHMERNSKTQHLISAAGLPEEKCRSIILSNEDNPHAITRELGSKLVSNQHYWVNLTGGNKIMFLAVHNFFIQKNARLFYMPIGKGYFVELGKEPLNIPVKTKLTVKQYFASYGIYFESDDGSKIKPLNELKEILHKYQQNDYEVNAIIANLPESEKHYYTGIWFEEYIYHKIKQQFSLADGYIELNLRANNFINIPRFGNDSELDVVFTLDNELYVIEAKINLGGAKNRKQNLDKIMFKLSALNKNFGLRSHAWIATLADLYSWHYVSRKDVFRKLKVLGISGINDRAKIVNNRKLLQNTK